MSQQENVNKKVSLKEFVEENYRLLAVIGVFGGLTTLFTRLENAEYLASSCFMIFLLLTSELYTTSLKYNEKSFRMVFFEYLLVVVLLNLALYLVQIYIGNLLSFLVGVSPILFGGALLNFLRKSKRIVKFRRILMYIGLAILGLFTGFFLAVIVELLF